MAFYRDRILPHLIKHAMRGKNLVPYRARAGYARGLKPMSYMYEGSARPE